MSRFAEKMCAINLGSETEGQREKKSFFLATSLIVAWILFTASAFWYFQWQYVRSYDQNLPRNTARWFDSDTLQGMFQQSMQAGSSGLVVHFWDPSCPCSRFSRSHVQDLIQQSVLQGASTVVVVKPSGSVWSGDNLIEAKELFSQSDWVISADQLPDLQGRLAGSPAAAVMDVHGDIRYIGPYSSDAFCRTNNEGFVELALADLLLDSSSSDSRLAINSACFCDW